MKAISSQTYRMEREEQKRLRELKREKRSKK